MVFKHKAKKTSLQIRIPENLDNKDPKRETHMDLIYIGSRKRQALLSKLGVKCDHGRGLKGREKEGGPAEKNV